MRKTVWLIFSAALVLALALPVATVVQQRWSTLQARATVWPAHPKVGTTVHLIVSLADSNDQAAVGGPWAQLVATWNMPEMEMETHQATLQGTQSSTGTFVVPLQLDMAGRWSVQVILQTPGRPTWRGTVDIIALPGNEISSAATT
ncbi:MAG: FixH family protein [Ktedonobacterales bacterium]